MQGCIFCSCSGTKAIKTVYNEHQQDKIYRLYCAVVQLVYCGYFKVVHRVSTKHWTGKQPSLLFMKNKDNWGSILIFHSWLAEHLFHVIFGSS